MKRTFKLSSFAFRRISQNCFSFLRTSSKGKKIDKNFLKENQVIIFQQLSKYCKTNMLDRKKKSQNENFHWIMMENFPAFFSCNHLVRLETQSTYLHPPWITQQAFSSKDIISVSKEKLETQLILSVLFKKIIRSLTKGGTKLEKAYERTLGGDSDGCWLDHAFGFMVCTHVKSQPKGPVRLLS